LRRPNCGITNDFCHPTTAANTIVSSCSSNSVNLSNDGWVLNDELVYILPTAYVTKIGSCTSPSSPSTCCNYVAPSVSATLLGLCPYSVTNVLFTIEQDDDQGHDGHEGHHFDDDEDFKK